MCFYIDKCLDCQTKTNGAPYCVPCLWKQYELKCSQLAAAEKELFELQTCMSGRFWMCMKCQRITHSHNCVHQCLCGNWPSSGYFASATFGQWELQNQGAFAAWRADRLATYPPKPASGTEQGQRGGE